MKIAVIIGSLRKESLNRKLANALMGFAPDNLQLEIIEIGDLPIYNQDFDENPPEAWTTFRLSLKNYQGVLFVTPEYNRSIPGVLKNAIDVGSRPYGQSAWNEKPCAVISLSPGALGGFGANHHLRQCLICLNMPTMAQPEAYIGGAGHLFGPAGEIVNEDTIKHMKRFMAAFAKYLIVYF